MFSESTVREWMSVDVVVVTPTTTVEAAQQIMQRRRVRHLPVVDGKRLVGLITSTDIERARPSEATSLSVWEMNYLWSQVLVERVMQRAVLTARPEDTLVEAVRKMLNHKYGCVPVVNRDGDLVGILTETDVFRYVLAQAEVQLAVPFELERASGERA